MKKAYESPDMKIVLFTPLENTNGDAEIVSGSIRTVTEDEKDWK